jgi:nucleoside-diphosphate-sugar epimerase
MSLRRILVTGSSGFIGQAVSKQLKATGHEVVSLARQASTKPHDGATITTAGADPASLRLALAGQRFDWVLHLGSYGVTPGEDRVDDMIAGTLALPAALVQAFDPVPRVFLQVGSCAEYDNLQAGALISESHSVNGESLYGTAKAAGARFAAAAAARRAIAYQWVRLFGVYGPGEAAHRLPSEVIRGILQGAPVKLSHGRQQRDLLYIDDAAAGLIRAAEIAEDGRLGPFNICTGDPVTIRSVCETIADRIVASRDLLQFGSRALRSGEQMWMVGDNRAFAAASGWRPVVPLEQGLERLIKTVRDQG